MKELKPILTSKAKDKAISLTLLIALGLGLSAITSFTLIGQTAIASDDIAMPAGFVEVSASEAFLPRDDTPYDVSSMADGPVKTSILNLLVEGGISKYPDNSFRPNKAVTRAELAVAVDKTFQLPPNKKKISIKDVKTSFWAYASIKRALQYLPLYSDKSFRPNAAATREDVAAALVAVSGASKTGSNPSDLDIIFADANSVSPEIKDLMSVAINNGLMKAYKVNDEYYLKPQGLVTRAELAYLLDQGMKKVGVGLKTAPKSSKVKATVKTNIKTNK